MSVHETGHPSAHTIEDLQLLQGLLAQRLYVNERDRQLLRTLLDEVPQQRRRRAARRGSRRLRASSAALVFGSALALTLGSPLLSATAASPQPAVAVVADRAADNLAPEADDALLRALLNSPATARQAGTSADKAAPQAEAALAKAELSVGETLLIPAMQPDAGALATPPIAVEQQNVRYYVVRSGDTLSGIAAFFYGNGDLWPTIFNANADKIADPHWIFPNQQLVIPLAATYTVQYPTVPAQSGRGPGQYTVQAGDTLSAIAAYAYGNGNAWWGIYQANTYQIANPDLIYPGQVLTIP